MAINLTEEQSEGIIMRNTLLIISSCGKIVSKSYSRKLSPEDNKRLLSKKLDSILSFCNTISIYSRNRPEAYEKDKYLIDGIEKIYSNKEINEIVALTDKYRHPFDKISKCERLDDLEYLVLMVSGDFFDEINKKAKERLPTVNI